MLHSPSARPSIIFFDAAGTLFHLPRGIGEHYREVALRHGVDRPAKELDAAFRQAWKAATPPGTTRQLRVDDDKEWWRALVDQVFALSGWSTSRGNFFDDLYLEFTKPGVWELYPEVRQVLEQLRTKYRLGIISNFDGRLRAVLRHLDIDRYFDPIVISSEVGADKPDAYIYQRAAELAGVPIQQALHIGDDPQCDWQGAVDAGMISWKLQRPQSTLATLLPLLDR